MRAWRLGGRSWERERVNTLKGFSKKDIEKLFLFLFFSCARAHTRDTYSNSVRGECLRVGRNPFADVRGRPLQPSRRGRFSNLHSQGMNWGLSLSLSLSLSSRTCFLLRVSSSSTFFLLSMLADDQCKRRVNVTWRHCRCEETTPQRETAARDFSRAQKPPRDNWTWFRFAHGVVAPSKRVCVCMCVCARETRRRRGRRTRWSTHMGTFLLLVRWNRSRNLASGKIDRQVKQM